MRSENGPENCIINCQGASGAGHRGFYVHGGTAIIDGFTITNGYAQYGAGIYFRGSTATAMNNIITGNTSGTGKYYGGGGIRVKGGSPTIINNIIAGNRDLQSGGGIRCTAGGSPVIANNTIASNTAATYGGGIYSDGDSSPEIIDNTIIGNTARHGAGVSCIGSSPSITGNMIADNTAASSGGGIFCEDASPDILNNVITENLADGTNSGGAGGGIRCVNLSPMIVNNTIAGNTASGKVAAAGGLYLHEASSTVVKSCIIWNNSANIGREVEFQGSTASEVTFSNVRGGCPGLGNIDADPLFVDPDNGDYHLKSENGRWDPAADDGTGAWVADSVTSPSIDAGDPGSDFANEPEPNGTRVNLGAYGNTPEASKSAVLLTVQSTPVTGLTVTGDKPGTTDYTAICNNEEFVSLAALPMLLEGGKIYTLAFWLVDGRPQIPRQPDLQLTMDADHTALAVYDLLGDVNGDCTVNILDLLFVRNRLQQNPDTGDNWRADANQDGDVNIIDLLWVRNNLRAECP